MCTRKEENQLSKILDNTKRRNHESQCLAVEMLLLLVALGRCHQEVWYHLGVLVINLGYRSSAKM